MAPDGLSSVAILVVEDEFAMRRLIRRMLERNRCKVYDAGSAQLGLALLDKHQEIQLAVVDLAAEMSRRHAGIQVLYISGYVGSLAIQAIADRHPEAVLLKPFTEQRLI